jgi:hypothetical protein
MVTLQFVPYKEIQDLSSLGKIRKLLNIAKQNKIVLLQGRLKKEEEAELIKVTMEEINKEFKGIELAVINSSKKTSGLMDSFRSMVLGHSEGLTVIGPASVVKKIKRNPNKIELLTKEKTRKRK